MIIPDDAIRLIKRTILDLDEMASKFNKESQFESSNEVLELIRQIENLINQ